MDWIILIPGLLTLMLGISVFVRNPKASLNKSFMLFCFFAFALILIDFLFRFYPEVIILRTAFALAALLPPLSIIWILEIIGVPYKKLSFFIRAAIILPPTFFFFFAYTDWIIINIIELTLLGYYGYLGSLFPFYSFYFLIYIIISISLLVLFYRREKSDHRKKQFFYICVGIIVYGFFAVTFSLILPSFFNNFNYTLLDAPSIIFFVGFASYSILRLKLFNVKLFFTEILFFLLWGSLALRLILSTSFWDFIINFILLLAIIFIGFFLIKNVSKEIRQREEIEKLAQKLQKTNEELKELDKMKTEFLSLATHQIRSPLTSMRGYISMIFEGDYGEVNENLKEPLKVVEKSSEGLIKVVNDFLDVSRIEQGRMKYNLEVCDFRQIVKNIIEEYRPAIEEKGLKIEFEAKEDDYSVKIDENKMEQVIGNLIDNAIKYTIDGEIKVHLFKNDSKTVQLEISDSGVGIPPEEIKKLFTKFQRAKGAEKTNVTGTGLGIYLAKRITEDHGGTIKVYSDGEGKGAVFTVTLPVV